MNTIKQPTEITFDFRFSYQLTEKGQRLHLLSGGNGKAFQVVEGQITLADAEALGIRFTDGRLSDTSLELRTGKRESYADRFETARYDEPLSFEQTLAEALKFRVLHLEHFAAEKALKQEARGAALSGETHSYRTSHNFKVIEVKWKERTFSFSDDPELIAMHDARRKAREEAEEAAKAAKEAADAAREQAKADQIAAWVAAQGTADQKERLEAGLFPRDEAVQAIKNAAFQPGDNLGGYERINKADIEHDDECRSQYDGDWSMDCESSDAAAVSADEWVRLKTVKALFPEAVECAIKRHSCKCDQCEESVERSGIYVKLQVGAFTFNREFAI